jgi:hypothetical protein
MTTKAEFTEQEWDLVRLGPTVAGLIVITAERGGTMRETFEMAKVYASARSQHGQSELLDEIVASKPERDHTHYKSFDELKSAGLEHIRDAVKLLEAKATPEELEDYRGFVRGLAERVAARHEENGTRVSASEQAAIDEIGTALGRSG